MNTRCGVIILLAGLSVLSGCQTSRNLANNGYAVETVVNSQVWFSQVWASEEAGVFKVTGKLYAKEQRGSDIPDHIEVSLVDPDGNLLDRQTVRYCPRMLTGQPSRDEARFAAQFDQVPPEGTIVRLSNVE